MRKALLDSFIWRGAYFLTTLILNVCIARVYEAGQSGWIYFISNNFFLVLLIGGLSLDSSMTYFSASDKIASNKLFTFAVTWSFVVAAFSIACTIVLAQTGVIKGDCLFLLIAGVAYTFGISLTNFFTSLFYARHNFALPNILISSINILVIALIPLFAKGYFGLSRNEFLYLYFLQFVLQGIGLTWLYKRSHIKLQPLQYPMREEYKGLFRFAIIALSANIAYYLINRIDYFFVHKWCSDKALGNYVQVSKMGQLCLIIPQIIASTIYPQAAKSDNPNVVKLIVRMMLLFVVLYLLLFVAAYFLSNRVFLWLFGGTFNEMYVPFLLLLPGILFLSIHTLVAAYFGGKNKPGFNVLSTGIGLVIVVIGDIILIRPYGIGGAAFVSSLGYITTFIVSLFLFLRMTGTGVKSIFSADMFRPSTYASFFLNQSQSAR